MLPVTLTLSSLSRWLYLVILSLFFIQLSFPQEYGTLTDERDGQVYQTVKIGHQWWMAENLNYGTQIEGAVNSTNNKLIEKYCYSDMEGNCDKMGALYQWNELMNYTYFPVNQGICPTGWHIPSDDEWKELEKHLGMSDKAIETDDAWRGTDEGTQLKTGGSSGFEGDLNGMRSAVSSYLNHGVYAYFWTSNNYSRYLGAAQTGIFRRLNPSQDYGFAVRCVKDEDTVTFSYVPVSLSNSSHISKSTWGDYNNDGYLDILYGNSLYQNTGSSYVFDEGTALLRTEGAFGDFNNDGYLDYFSTQTGDWTCPALINQNTGSSFTSTDLGLCCTSYPAFNWGDMNNDGDIDLLITRGVSPPFTDTYCETTLFENLNKTSFSEKSTNLKDLRSGSVSWGDIDGDMDFDLFLTGKETNSNKTSVLYKNNNGNFTEYPANIANVSSGDATIEDFDGDGLPDIILTGYNNTFIAKIYKNNGDFSFTDIQANISGYAGGSLQMGDIDNDGDKDIIVTGIETIDLYLNEGGSYFTKISNIYPGISTQHIALGDYDNDNDLDILVDTCILKNQINKLNLPPEVPENLKLRILNNVVSFDWDPSSDDRTPTNALTYNLRIGTTINGGEIMCPPSYNSSNYLKIPQNGNVGQNTSWKITGLETGTYYWSVQAVDASYNASYFSVRDTFEISDYSFTSEKIMDNPGGFEYYAMDVSDYDSDGDYDILLTSKTSADASKIFKNTSVSFSEAFVNLPQVKFGDSKWMDFDKDNIPEILLMGKLADGSLVFDIYAKSGVDHFEPLHTGMLELHDGSVDYADYDNDGDNDILCTGKDSIDNPHTIIYKNNAGTLEEVPTDIIQIWGGSGVWADINNDSQMDIILSGKTNDNTINLAVYLNKRTYFEELYTNMEQLFGEIDVGDINQDQYIDFVIVGYDTITNKYSTIYLNSEGNGFTKHAELPGLSSASVEMGDYNHDGNNDILLSGYYSGTETKLLTYTEEGLYTEHSDIGNIGGSACYIDYDLDGDLDIVSMGNSHLYTCYCSYLFNNNGSTFDSKPDPPINLSAERYNYGIKLNWEPATDIISTYGGLSYNVKIGTSPNNQDIVYSMSADNGNLFINKLGNAGLNTTYIIDSLPLGTYYWSVQAIDHEYRGGNWSETQSFTITNVSTDFTHTLPCINTPVQFTDISVSTNFIVQWKWDFGDSTFSDTQHPIHTYTSIDTVNVILWAYSESGDSLSRTREIIVKPSPTASFTVEPVCYGESSDFINLSDTSSVYVASWVWDFGNGETSTSRTDVSEDYHFSDTATLTITSVNGCTDADTQIVSVVNTPVIDIPPGMSVKCPYEELEFTITNYSPDAAYQWYINDELIETLYIPAYNSLLEGNYYTKASLESCASELESNHIQVTFEDDPPKPQLFANDGPNEYLIVCSNRNANFYQWYYMDEMIPGANEYYHLVYTDYGEYFVELAVNGYDCRARSDVIKIPDTYTGIHDNDLKEILEIYPNPAKNEATLFWLNPYTGKFQIQLFDIMGNLLYVEQNHKIEEEYRQILDLENYVPGIYYIKLTADKFETNKKFVIRR